MDKIFHKNVHLMDTFSQQKFLEQKHPHQMLRRLPPHLHAWPGGDERVRQAGPRAVRQDPSLRGGGAGAEAPHGIQLRPEHGHWIQGHFQV